MALSRDTLIEALVIGATAGLFAAGVNIAARYTSDPGDVLGFIGGAVGAGAAVIGALWLERVKVRSAERERLAALARILVGLARRSAGVIEADEDRRLGTIQTLRQTIGTFLAMRATHVLPDPERQATLDTFSEIVERRRAALAEAEQGVREGTLTLAGAVEQLRPQLIALIDSVHMVLRVDTDWPRECRSEAAALVQRFADG